MHAYRVGFTQAFTSILIIAASVALAGSAFAFALVRSSDFVASGDAVAESDAAPAAASG
ncbi:MAG: hypothetical protein QOI18_844, partial [Solirubrobacteraceae bacterium]|nr:hypothetical protein [Solirubrobacteraceae bacterium]